MILMTVQNVSKSFGMNCVLKDISLTLQQGARMGLIGVNGSGKSTLLRMIAGQMEPDEGSIALMRGTRVGMLTQEADIQSDLTVREELSRVFEPVREMERRLRALEEEMAQTGRARRPRLCQGARGAARQRAFRRGKNAAVPGEAVAYPARPAHARRADQPP